MNNTESFIKHQSLQSEYYTHNKRATEIYNSKEESKKDNSYIKTLK